MATDTKKSAGPALPDSIKVTMPDEEHHELRDLVYQFSGPPHCLTLTTFIRDAINEKVVRERKRLNGGKKSPRRDR